MQTGGSNDGDKQTNKHMTIIRKKSSSVTGLVRRRCHFQTYITMGAHLV